MCMIYDDDLISNSGSDVRLWSQDGVIKDSGSMTSGCGSKMVL